MAKRKWYVVTVGKGIGVFPTWLEAGPLVKGVPDALHQSFPTEEEATLIFAQEKARGNTRIVTGAQEKPSPRKAYVSSPAYFDSGSASPGSTESSIIIKSPHLMKSKNVYSSGRSARPPQNFVQSAPQSPSAISRSASEPSSSMRRFEIINALFHKESAAVGVKARASLNQHAQASTPTSDPTSLRSPRRKEASRSPHAIVKTPSWLTSYPKASPPSSQPLSPLNNADLSLNSFKDSLCEKTPLAADMASVLETPSMSESSIYLSPSVHPPNHITYEHNVDPRSPIINQPKMPELVFMNSLSFARPSPSIKGEQLPLETHSSAVQSSLLFKPSSPVLE
ncbi:hypothetical protein BDZ97DRAFT_2070335 [Flammula alnicola]|nr:hypothetical protein BDZ97DRAFT_2070335 [Flammula alnicola]